MSSEIVPVLHALSVEPRTARAGETVRVVFRTRNVGTTPSPAGIVRFALGDGLEALDAAEAGVASVPPGEDVVAAIAARVVGPLADRTEIAVGASLHVDGRVLAANVCALVVRSTAVLDGPASGTFVEALGPDRVRVRTVVTNEGDGPAFGVRIVVPPPDGCTGADPAHRDDAVAVARLDPGERAERTFEARVVEACREVRGDGGEVRYGDGMRAALPARASVVLRPSLAPPRASVTVSRRRVELDVEVANDGWVDAHDVCVRILLPRELRAIESAVSVDGVPVASRGVRLGRPNDTQRARPGRRRATEAHPIGRAERDRDAHVVIVAVVPARGCAQVSLAASVPAQYAGGTVHVSVDQHHVDATFVIDPVRDVRVRAVDVPRSAVPGERIRIAARVVNAGDVAEQLSFACAGSLISSSVDMPRRVLPAGTWSLVEAPVQVRDDAPDGAVVRGAFIVSDANGERASDSVTFRIRDRMTVAPAEPPPAESSPAPSVRTVLHAPRGVFAGAAFETRLELHAGTQIETLRVRIPEVAGCRYVSGSAALDGRALLDRVSGSSDGSPLADDGLVIGGIAAGSRLALAWRLFAQTSTDGGAVRVSASIDADGVAHAVESDALEIVEPDSFAVRPDGLAYHVASCAVDPSQTVASGVPADRAIVAPACASEILSASPIDTPAELPPHRGVLPARAGVGQFTLRFDAQRVDDLARLAGAAPRDGLVQHLFALRFFFPDSADGADHALESALNRVREALRDTFDRLYVKLRIPAFDVTSDDLDDAALRSSLIALFDILVDCVADEDTFARVRSLAAALPQASYGAPSVLRAMTAVLPSRCTGDASLGEALRHYAAALDDALACYDGLPLEIFDEALVRRSDPALERAREAVFAALPRHVAAVPC